MSDNMTVFEDTIEDEPQVDPEKDYLSELVGEGKRYRDPQVLARSAVEKDNFIERLKGETAQLRAELATRIKYEEFLDKLNSSPPSRSTEEPPVPHDPANVSALKPEDIASLVEQKLQQREQQSIAERNLSQVKETLSKTLGPNYGQKVKQKAQELEVGEAFLNDLAKTNPKAFYRLLGITETREPNLFSAPPRSQMNTDSFAPTGSSTKGKSFYDKIYAQDRNLYFSPKIQNEMFKQMSAMGIEEFNSR